ncbi:TPA: aldose 1-epimerase family protein [Citrobacter farmeri]|uniref:DUF4432 domain-containing protein n=2 Tax=Citrobacter farmeri TaxID=67824 RepID=A0ACA8D1G4_9ENTR|nr:aldose 1-epimerase family protein [Citrobacter farmeri]HAT2170475.1 aldose 1-epimerase family protein [Citrobacter freundii]AST78012.1 DUF4432 domain-containing protein [Citrobacter farmeri]EMB4693287.1 aldose 1-epimerase family protein [Citrobacter farmeri]MCP1691434.1 hypothetical protein [Citrobacter farmeri]MCW2422431.1 hypothetical protein [Citrobacter farmeri]
MKNEIWPWIGDLSQVAGIKHYELCSGRAKGTEAFDVRTGGGLSFTVVKDRALDIAWASYKETSLSFIAPGGMVAPTFFEPQGNGFLRSFYAGLLTTCGLSYIGTPCEDDGETLGLHGRLASIPAEEVGYRTERSEKGIEFIINGKVRETRLFGENLTLERTIRCTYGGNVLHITDKVTNNGFTPQPLQILYHFNYGWPLLSPEAEIILSARRVVPRTPRAEEGLADHLTISPPQPGFAEQVYYMALNSDEEGMSKVALFNHQLGWGIYEKFNTRQLPNFIQWKNLGAGEYVMGLEVSNSFPDGRAKERAQGRLAFIQPGETVNYDFELGIVENEAAIEALKMEIGSYR